MKPYEMHARHSVRLAWRSMGRAREARLNANFADTIRISDDHMNYARDMVRIARGYMHNAVLYRQMNEVL